MAIATISIVFKEWIFRYTLNAAKKVKSHLMEANAWHSRSDALSSVVVLVGVVATWFGYAWVELLAAIGVAILIGHMGVKLTWNATQDLVDRGIEPEEAKAIKSTIQSTPGVVDVHMLRSRMMGNHIYLDVHIQVDQFSSVSEGHFIAENVMRHVNVEYDQVSDITVHVDHEYDVEDDSDMAANLPDRQFIEAMLSNNNIVPKQLQIHYHQQSIMLDLYFIGMPDNISEIKKNMAILQEKHVWLKNHRFFLEE
jgi:divalent metal cation (Fe/Co/Zn/Cd) transporter